MADCVIFRDGKRSGNSQFRRNYCRQWQGHNSSVERTCNQHGDLAAIRDLYFADTESHTVRALRKSSGIVETVIGDGKPGDGPDGNPKHCRLNRPHGVFVSADDWLYIGDSSNHRFRRLRLLHQEVQR